MISDTHGLLRPEALAALRGSDYIIHAGDVGDPQFSTNWPKSRHVTAVRGNVDHGAWAKKLPATNVLEIGEVSIYVLHSIQDLDLKPEAAKFAAVVYGHSHVPKQEMKKRRALFQSRKRWAETLQAAVTVGRLTIENSKIKAEILRLEKTT